MSTHDLATEFPQFKEAIHKLKIGNPHFARLFDSYHEIDKQINRIEQGVEAHSSTFEEDLRKQRMQLKDELYAMMTAATDDSCESCQ
ncbi:MAG: DUF465 domain-containing protein [Proteobacteria bacterium]|nr:DUF465 domain-containing protein [Pseudomonadota bacterium]